MGFTQHIEAQSVVQVIEHDLNLQQYCPILRRYFHIHPRCKEIPTLAAIAMANKIRALKNYYQPASQHYPTNCGSYRRGPDCHMDTTAPACYGRGPANQPLTLSGEHGFFEVYHERIAPLSVVRFGIHL